MGNVVFIESMPEGSYDFLGLMKCEIKDNPLYQGLNVCFETVENKKDFKEVVTCLLKQVSKETTLVLHLCVHGDVIGMAFKGYEVNQSDDDCILWDEFIQTVKPLNEAVGCNLILFLQACYSSSLGEKFSKTKFCKCLIAGEGLVPSKELELLFQFYKTYAETMNVKSAYDAMINTKYIDVYHNEIQISSIYKCFLNDVSEEEKKE